MPFGHQDQEAAVLPGRGTPAGCGEDAGPGPGGPAAAGGDRALLHDPGAEPGQGGDGRQGQAQQPVMPVTLLLPAVKLLRPLIKGWSRADRAAWRSSGDVSCATGSSGRGPRAVAVCCPDAAVGWGPGPGPSPVAGSCGHGS